MKEAEQQMARSMGVSRFGQPEEIARLVAFLASPQAAFCQGSIVDADGGADEELGLIRRAGPGLWTRLEPGL